MSNFNNWKLKMSGLAPRLASARGREYWQCLGELSGSDAFREAMREEFPMLADVWPDALNRRKFLSLMGA